MAGDLPVAVKQVILSLAVTGSLTKISSLLTANQLTDLGAATPVDGWIIAPAGDSILVADLGLRPTELLTIPPGSSWQMPVNNWLAACQVKSLSGGAATATLVVYVQ